MASLRDDQLRHGRVRHAAGILDAGLPVAGPAPAGELSAHAGGRHRRAGLRLQAGHRRSDAQVRRDAPGRGHDRTGADHAQRRAALVRRAGAALQEHLRLRGLPLRRRERIRRRPGHPGRHPDRRPGPAGFSAAHGHRPRHAGRGPEHRIGRGAGDPGQPHDLLHLRDQRHAGHVGGPAGDAAVPGQVRHGDHPGPQGLSRGHHRRVQQFTRRAAGRRHHRREREPARRLRVLGLQGRRGAGVVHAGDPVQTQRSAGRAHRAQGLGGRP